MEGGGLGRLKGGEWEDGVRMPRAMLLLPLLPLPPLMMMLLPLPPPPPLPPGVVECNRRKELTTYSFDMWRRMHKTFELMIYIYIYSRLQVQLAVIKVQQQHWMQVQLLHTCVCVPRR